MTVYPYEATVEPESVGIDPRKLARATGRFQKQHRAGAFPGGQLVIRRHGKPVLNIALGIARGFRPAEAQASVPVLPHTPFPALSVGKPLAAIVIAMLEDRGLLDVHAPISEIFGEFVDHSKQQITTLDVLTHRSGMLMPDFVSKMERWGDREAIQQALIDTVPAYPRGTLAYHPHEYGWILDEIVLRIDGRSLPDFFHEEIAMPLRLPALCFGLAGRDPDSVAYTYWLGEERVMVAGINVAQDFEMQNSAPFFEARNPATSLLSDAASLAAFYEFLLSGGHTSDGQPLISQETIRRYTSKEYQGWDRSLKTFLAVGRGFVVGTLPPSSFGWWNTRKCFGHAGGFSSLAFADYSTNIAVAIITNGNRSLKDFTQRFIPLAHELRKACN